MTGIGAWCGLCGDAESYMTSRAPYSGYDASLNR
jgi:hypothetical protein